MAGLICGAGFALLAIYVFWGTRGMSALGSIFPATISLGMILFSLGLIAAILTGRAAPAMAREEGAEGWTRRLALAAIMAAWVMLLPEIGFLVSSLIAFAAIMVTADYDRPRVRTWAIWTLSGAAIVVAFWWVMVDVLVLRVPSGIFF